MMRFERSLISIATVIAFLALWEIAARLDWITPRFFGEPSTIFQAGRTIVASPVFLSAVVWSTSAFLIGFAFALVVGIPLGLVVGYSRYACELFDPVLMAFNSTPRTALIPLVLIWCGIGVWSESVVVFLGGFFPIAVNLAAGLQRIDPSWLKAARSFGCSEARIFRTVLLPSSVPHLMTGIRLGLGRAVIGVIVAEMFASQNGVGRLMIFAAAAVNTNELMFLALAVSVFGIFLVKLTEAVEKWLAPWQQGFAV
jgi:ABC-type nitrate/sulfonate/bicarbonate transport system permease component